MTNPFIAEAMERGLLDDCTAFKALSERLERPTAAYVGIDLTADSLHVGHLLPLMAMRLLQRKGHTPVVVLGSGTTMVGDPSGRDTQRQMLTERQIVENGRAIQRTVEAVLPGARILDNMVWLAEFSHIEFLRRIGSRASVNRMLTLESVRSRLDREQPLTYLEFGYSLLQAYDFVALHEHYGVELQIGGSDQWGNIVMGIDLAHKMTGATLYGVTVPLLTTADGKKMGKTAAGAVWLSPERTSPFDYWQFWRNTADADVIRFLCMFTEIDMERIRAMSGLKGEALNEAKKLLATEATAIVHGRAAAEEAAESARRAFEEGAADDNLPWTVGFPGQDVEMAVRDLGFASSLSEARRLIEGGGVRINGDKAEVGDALTHDDFRDGVVQVSVGKRRRGVVRLPE